jgi:hypothetical protein
MPSSTKAQIQETRRELVACGVDPFLLLAQALQRNEELQDQVEMLTSFCKRHHKLPNQTHHF